VKDKFVDLVQRFADQVLPNEEDREAYMNMVRGMYDQLDEFWLGSNQVPVEIIYTENYNGGEDNEKLTYAKEGDSGFDLRAATNETGGYQVAPKSVIVVPTGIKVAVPSGYELQVRTRSGSPLKKGFNVANSPGTVDSGYRGEVGVLVHNLSDEVIDIPCGERIAQGVICPVMQAKFVEVDELDATERGDGAYNSTGVN
jgi:dUTP pyrophosphatase